ncbi:MAG: glutamyl-tRNA reductase [Polyangiales bacterium]
MQQRVWVLGLSHHSAPVAVREAMAVTPDKVAAFIQQLQQEAGAKEAVVLSTCNRVEVYAASDDVQTAVRAAEQLWLGHSRRADGRAHLYLHHGEAALRHSFRVAASLDSMVVGEPQILGQVKAAVAAARSAGGVGAVLGPLFDRAFSVAKQVRRDTGIAAGAVSVSSIACELATKIFADLSARQVLLVGAGKMGEAAARQLHTRGARLTVANRRRSRAEAVAQAAAATVQDFAALDDALVVADVVITSTASPDFILTPARMAAAQRARKRRPLFIIDIAVPRNVDPRVGALDNVFLYDVDDLEKIAATNLAQRQEAAQMAEALVSREVQAFVQWLATLELKPTILALRAHFQAIVLAELKRSARHLPALNRCEQQALEHSGQAIVNKLLHTPLTLLRAQAEGPQGLELIAALRQLFDLQEGDSTCERPSTTPPQHAARTDTAAPPVASTPPANVAPASHATQPPESSGTASLVAVAAPLAATSPDVVTASPSGNARHVPTALEVAAARPSGTRLSPLCAPLQRAGAGELK